MSNNICINNINSVEELTSVKNTIKAFLCPELFPFLLEAYIYKGYNEEKLLNDIKKAKNAYKDVVIKLSAYKEENTTKYAKRKRFQNNDS